MAINDADAERNAQASQEQEKEVWYTPNDHWPQEHEYVEFVTNLGAKHQGIAISILHNDHRNSGRFTTRRHHILFVTEDTTFPQYFGHDDIERWRRDMTPIKKKRYVGEINPSEPNHGGYLIPIFVNYLMFRSAEKFKLLDMRFRLNLTPTVHYINESGVEQWETSVNDGEKMVTFIELNREDEIEIKFTGPEPFATKRHSFRDVATKSEDIIRWFLQGR